MELFAADGHDAGGCERVTGKSGMRPPCQVSTRSFHTTLRSRRISVAYNLRPRRHLGPARRAVGVQRNPCSLTGSACGGSAFFAARRASWLCPLQLVRALSPLRGFTRRPPSVGPPYRSGSPSRVRVRSGSPPPRLLADPLLARKTCATGYQAVQLRVVEHYVEKLGLLAKENDTMIVPITVGDASSFIAENVVPRTTRVGAIPCWGNSRLRTPSSRVRSVHLFRPLLVDYVSRQRIFSAVVAARGCGSSSRTRASRRTASSGSGRYSVCSTQMFTYGPSRNGSLLCTCPYRFTVPSGTSPGPFTCGAHADAGRKKASGCHRPIVMHRRWRHTRRRRPPPGISDTPLGSTALPFATCHPH